LTTQQVAAMTGLTPEWYHRARKTGLGPPFQKVSARIIRYDRDEVLAWFREHRTTVS